MPRLEALASVPRLLAHVPDPGWHLVRDFRACSIVVRGIRNARPQPQRGV